MIRILFVQVGDYKEAFERFKAGGQENYANQQKSVEAVGDLVSETTEAIVICTRAQPYDTLLDNGVRAIGLDNRTPEGQSQLKSLISSLQPTHLIVRGPNRELIKHGLDLGIEVLPIFADSFNNLSFRRRLRVKRLVKLLNRPQIRLVSNHNINASKSLCVHGVNPAKVVPYDYLRPYAPDQFEPKALPQDTTNIRLVYVGVISQAKGTFDVIDALPILKELGINANLTVIGGDDGSVKEYIQSKKIDTDITMLGKVPNAQVISEMRAHDAVIVPSRPSYPEGLPHTIFESLATRTPLIASDHPMFTPVLHDGESCVMFPAGKPQEIAQATLRLLQTPGLYEQISLNTPKVWQQLMMPLNWHDVIELWLDNTPEATSKLHECSVASIHNDHTTT